MDLTFEDILRKAMKDGENYENAFDILSDSGSEWNDDGYFHEAGFAYLAELNRLKEKLLQCLQQSEEVEVTCRALQERIVQDKRLLDKSETEIERKHREYEALKRKLNHLKTRSPNEALLNIKTVGDPDMHFKIRWELKRVQKELAAGTIQNFDVTIAETRKAFDVLLVRAMQLNKGNHMVSAVLRTLAELDATEEKLREFLPRLPKFKIDAAPLAGVRSKEKQYRKFLYVEHDVKDKFQ